MLGGIFLWYRDGTPLVIAKSVPSYIPHSHLSLSRHLLRLVIAILIESGCHGELGLSRLRLLSRYLHLNPYALEPIFRPQRHVIQLLAVVFFPRRPRPRSRPFLPSAPFPA